MTKKQMRGRSTKDHKSSDKQQAARDAKVDGDRKHKKDPVTETLEQTFPASDPPPWWAGGDARKLNSVQGLGNSSNDDYIGVR